MNDNFSFEKLLEMKYEWVEETEYEEIDYELLKFDFERDEVKPGGIIKQETKTLNVRK